jgi:DNA-binding transcriptional MerR regulator
VPIPQTIFTPVSRRRPGTLRIGELAARTGLTAPTIRYYEQIGLLPGGPRPLRSHRIYTEVDVERLDLLRRLRDLLGVSLDELQEIAAAEETAAALPARIGNAGSAADRLLLVDEALRQSDSVLRRLRTRALELGELEQDLTERRHAIAATRITSG